MLQNLAISTFPETNYEFGILGQKSRSNRNFLKKSRGGKEEVKKVGKVEKKVGLLVSLSRVHFGKEF